MRLAFGKPTPRFESRNIGLTNSESLNSTATSMLLGEYGTWLEFRSVFQHSYRFHDVTNRHAYKRA